MSSNMEIIRICEFCKTEFAAQTTTTRYCSTNCNRKHWKAKARQQRINKSNEQTLAFITKQPLINDLKEKDFLNIKEVCLLLGVSKPTIYNLINKGAIKITKIGRRTIIKRSTIDQFFSK